MTQVETWVNDKLHDILGISDKYIAQYLIGLAKKSSSADEYIEKLRDTGTVEIDQNMVNFSQELWHKACILHSSRLIRSIGQCVSFKLSQGICI